jgi:hypothetical protein
MRMYESGLACSERLCPAGTRRHSACRRVRAAEEADQKVPFSSGKPRKRWLPDSVAGIGLSARRLRHNASQLLQQAAADKRARNNQAQK